jgi:hypothetical protein
MIGRHVRARRAALPAALTAVLLGGGAVAAGASPGCMPPPSGGQAPSSPAAILGALDGHPNAPAPAGPSGGVPATAVTSAAPAPGDPLGAALRPLDSYVQNEHVNRGLGAQVQDLAQADTWAGDHQMLARRMLDPEVGPGSAAAGAPVTGPLLRELDGQYWNTSPAEQVKRVADFDSWNLAQLELARRMADPAVGEHSTLGMSPGTGVVLHHLDNGHWNSSANGQVRALTDDFPDWYTAHQQMLQATAQSLQSGADHDDHHGPGHAH